jgi:hypothetical protein
MGWEKMAEKKRAPILTTRLSMNDHQRFLDTCKLEGKTQTQLVRQAILEMLDRQEQGVAAEIKDNLAERLKKMENRMAALLARNNLEIGIVSQLLWFRADPEKRAALFEAARKSAAKRISNTLKGGDLEIKELIKDSFKAEE